MNETLRTEIINGMGNMADFTTRIIRTMHGAVELYFIKDICDFKYISKNILEPLQRPEGFTPTLEGVRDGTLSACSCGVITSAQEAWGCLLSGNVLVLCE